MNRIRKLKKLLIILLIPALLAGCGIKKQDDPISIKANVMRLEKIAGNVSILEMGEKLIYVMEKMRLHSGYSVATERDSSAHISLDDSKAVKLDETSLVLLDKKGKDLLLTLSEGKMFFNVDKKLHSDESFRIKTSNAVVGIRGTSGLVVSRNEDESIIYLMTGKAEISAVSPVTGETKKDFIHPGEKITVYRNETALNEEQLRFVKGVFSESEIPDFVTEFVAGNISLREETETDPDWEDIPEDWENEDDEDDDDDDEEDDIENDSDDDTDDDDSDDMDEEDDSDDIDEDEEEESEEMDERDRSEDEDDEDDDDEDDDENDSDSEDNEN